MFGYIITMIDLVIQEKDKITPTPIGLKINSSSLGNNDIQEIVDALANYHKDKYVIGYDSVYCGQPHYHIHFWCHKKKEVTKNALKTFRSDLGKKFSYLTKSDKLYLGKNYLENTDILCWEGYAVKEQIIKSCGYDEDELSSIKEHAGIQNGIKKLKNIKSQEIAQVEKQKKDFRQKLFNYIDENIDAIAKSYDMYDSYLCNIKLGSETMVVEYAIVHFYFEEKRLPTKHHLYMYAREYMFLHNKENIDARKFLSTL